jgi:hypothetical protein
MNMQSAIVALVVLGCGLYALWVLLPLAARNWVRRVVLRQPARAADGCGACDSCAAPASPSGGKAAEHVVRVVRH